MCTVVPPDVAVVHAPVVIMDGFGFVVDDEEDGRICSSKIRLIM